MSIPMPSNSEAIANKPIAPLPFAQQQAASATELDEALSTEKKESEATALMPVPHAHEPNILSLTQFVQDFGASLLEAVRMQNPPVFDGQAHPQRAAWLARLKRQPFAAQAKIVQAVTRLLLDEDQPAAIINAEMGTGKTCMGIATAALLHAEGYCRTLVLCPPHLVYKWRREILETVANAKVVVLNGADALSKLQALQAETGTQPSHPTFYIIGRVRLRMGHHWRPAVVPRRVYGKAAHLLAEQEDHPAAAHVPRKTFLASCPQCGAFVKTAAGEYCTVEQVPLDKKLTCQQCHSPLWSLVHPCEPRSLTQQVHHALCQLPGIGNKLADKLIAQFGETLLASMLGDNTQRLVQLLDDNGEFVFSDRQAARLERALGQSEVNFGQAGYQASEFIKRYLPKNFFSLLIVDEAHEYKNVGSAQGQAMSVVAGRVKKVLLLTGTLMGGYGDDLFYLLWRVLPQQMMQAGYRYSQRGSLSAAAMAFLETYGVLKHIYKTTETGHHRTARGKRQTVHVLKAPGFSPVGVAQFVLPYTAFLKLQELDSQALPSYQEHFINVAMSQEQASAYWKLELALREALCEALAAGNKALLGVVLNALLAWPDCCFREETIIHPHSKTLLAYVPVTLGDDPSPKEAEMLALCQAAKQQGRRTLVYTIYTGTRDTTLRLKSLLTQAGLKTAVLRASITADKREAWIADQVDSGIDVLLCHPELVKTGLDLLAFPTIVFLQTGYNVYTLMQATRRSWRIGQTQPVAVYFLGYERTAQIKCLTLMAKKIAVSQSTSGTMPETGLDILNQGGESVEVALAKQLVKE